MNTRQLFRALKNHMTTKDCFDGIYAKDTLEDVQSTPQLIICNSAPSTHKGEHWLVFYFYDGDKVDFYDSLGLPLSYYGREFITFVERFAKEITYVTKRSQPRDTALCGIYCLFYAYYRCKGVPMSIIIKKMKTASYVCKVVRKLFRICSSSPCALLQMCIKL